MNVRDIRSLRRKALFRVILCVGDAILSSNSCLRQHITFDGRKNNRDFYFASLSTLLLLSVGDLLEKTPVNVRDIRSLGQFGLGLILFGCTLPVWVQIAWFQIDLVWAQIAWVQIDFVWVQVA